MSENRWQKIERIFNEAVVLNENERAEFVAQKCGDDADLQREVWSLLAHDSADDNFLSESVFSLGAEVLDNDVDNLLKKQVFGEYRLQKLLGRGGTSLVFLALDTRLERLVALKILPPKLTADETAIWHFRQEARAASTISHPNVAHIYEFGEFEGKFFLAMEYVAGKTLRQMLKEEKSDEKRAANIALQIAEALKIAHQNDIVHRDIKPENVIINAAGLLKVLDFGLAIIVSGKDTEK